MAAKTWGTSVKTSRRRASGAYLSGRAGGAGYGSPVGAANSGALVVRDETTRDQDSPSFEIDLPDTGLDEWEEQPALQL